MNKLPIPNVNDTAAFTSLSNNPALGSYPLLQPMVGTVQASYAQYMAVNGDPTLVQNPAISDATAKLFKGHYKSPPAELAYINKIRDASEHLVCPMCGSFHSGTLDHYLPKKQYPVFAVFSKNLVPACKCNSKRGDKLFGSAPGERVLHPYFDNCLSQRLLRAQFDDLGDVPKVSLALTIPTIHPDYFAIAFHVEWIVQRTAICKWLADQWSLLYRKPSRVIRAFRENIGTQAEVQALLQEELHALDDSHRGKNNWHSVFVSGLLEPPVLAWLAGRFSVPGRKPDDPLG